MQLVSETGVGLMINDREIDSRFCENDREVKGNGMAREDGG